MTRDPKGPDAHVMSDSTLAAERLVVEASDPDAEVLGRVREGDEQAFLTLVDRYGPMMLRLAMTYVRSRSVAEEVVQDAWIGILGSLPRFEGRSTVRTWMLRILANRARTRAVKEARCVPFSALGDE